MANAIIDTLRTKNTSGEEHILYPRSKTSAISDNNGKNLDTILSELDDRVTDSEFNDIYAETSLNLGRQEDTDIGECSGTIGMRNTATGESSFAVGVGNIVKDMRSMAFGQGNTIAQSSGYAYGSSVAIGSSNKIYNNAYNFTAGYGNTINPSESNGDAGYCLVAGLNNTVAGYINIALGDNNTTSNDHSVAIGRYNKSTGLNSIALGSYCEATGKFAVAESNSTIASGYASHSEGSYSTASGYVSHAEGYQTIASASQAHAEGHNTIAKGDDSHAEGSYTIAGGPYSHAEGYYTIATGWRQHVQGKYNVEDTEGKYAHIVGGGNSEEERKNIHTIDWDGNAVFSGSVADGNGATISGIETTTNYSIDTNIESLMHINSLTGRMAQDIDYQVLDYPLFTSITVSNGTESCSATSTDQIMLFGMNDVCDIIKDNKLTSRYQKIVLNGSENITLDSVTGCFLFSPTVKAKVSTKNIASNRYKYFETNTYDTNYGLFVLETGQIGINHDEFSTVDEYKTWLASNNVTIIYEKETEEVIDLDETFVNELNNLKLFVGENTITTNSTTSLNPIIEVDYATSKMAKYVLELLSIMKNTKNAEGGAY